MFHPKGGYNNFGHDASNEPYGTFKWLTIEDVDITVGPGAVQPHYVVRAEPDSTFGDITLSNIRINSAN